jgi:hypothetical protein
MKTAAWIGVLTLAGLLLAAGFRRRPPETPPPAKKPRAMTVAPAPVAAEQEPVRRTAERLKIRTDEVESFVAASRDVARELRRIQVQRQSEWSLDVDQETRLEWEERYDADRRAAVARLDPFLDGGEAHREFRDQIETWAATVWAREQGVYR